MIVYRGFKCFYLGLKRWRITAPDGIIFDVKVSDIDELQWRIILWRKIRWA